MNSRLYEGKDISRESGKEFLMINQGKMAAISSRVVAKEVVKRPGLWTYFEGSSAGLIVSLLGGKRKRK